MADAHVSPQTAAPPQQGVRRVFTAIIGWSSYLAAVAVVVILVGTVIHVVLRGLGGSGLVGVVELGEVILVVAVYLGLAYAQQEKAHVSTNIVTSRVPRGLAHGMRVVGVAMMVLFVGWIAWESIIKMLGSIEVGEYRFGIVQIPVWPARIALAVGVVLLFVQSVIDLVATVRERGGGAGAGAEGMTHLSEGKDAEAAL